MIKDNQRYFIRLQVVLDGAVIIFSYVVAWYFYLVASGRTEEIGVLPAQIYMTALCFLYPFFLFCTMPAICTPQIGLRGDAWRAAIFKG